MDVLDSIDKLLPLFFLFIWILSGVLTSKKKKNQRPGKPPHAKNVQSPGSSASKNTEGGGMGELRKKLQKVFEEIQAAVEQPETETTVLESQTFDETDKKEVTVEAPQSVAAAAESARSLETTPRRIPQPVFPTITETKRLKPIPSSEILRTGVILSEILAQPLGMRRPENGM